MLNKYYLPFFISVALFVVILAYSGFIYASWDNDFENGDTEVEISLPVINWENYSRLSKKPE